jgi:hypothetical protein
LLGIADLVRGDTPAFLKSGILQPLTVIGLLILASTLVTYGLGLWWSLTICESGIVARTYLGFKRHLRWDDIGTSYISYNQGIPYIHIDGSVYSLWVVALGFNHRDLGEAIENACGKKPEAFKYLFDGV